MKRVIVRVWTSEDNPNFPGNNVGHVSVEMPDGYMSLWPVAITEEQYKKYKGSNIIKQKCLKYFMERDPNWKSNYQEDEEAEGNPPQITVCLYSLDHYMIKNAFNKLKDETKGWRLIGSNLLVQETQKIVKNTKFFEEKKPTETIENCASLALKLLKAGGITKLLNFSEESSFSSKTSSVVKPDDLQRILIPAKLKELKEYPETKQFIFPDETPIEKLKNPKKENKTEEEIGEKQDEKKGGCILM